MPKKPKPEEIREDKGLPPVQNVPKAPPMKPPKEPKQD